MRLLRMSLMAVSTIAICVASSFAVESLSNEQIQVVRQAEQARIDAIAKGVRSTVAVFGPAGGGGGSGVVISQDGYALTNFHVAQPCGNYMRCTMADGNLYDAVIVSVDPTGDVALIKLLGRDDFAAAEFGDSDLLRPGQWCFAVGNPFLLATDFQPTVTYGIVSGVHRYQYPAGSLLEYADCIQTDASINPGNSGGPLFNSAGQLVGINGRGSFEKRGRVNVGVGYAISINQIKKFLGYLKSGRIVDHATMGATVTSDEDGRVVVSQILSSSDAYRRGLRYNDQIIAFGGRAIDTVNGFKNVLGIFPRGWRVPLTFLRDGERHDILVRLTGVHNPEELWELTTSAPPDQPRPPHPPGEPPTPDDQRETPQPNDDEHPGDDDEPDGERTTGKEEASKGMPEHVAKLYESRRGFANYYFNRLNQRRVWEACAAYHDLANQPGEWVLRAKTEQGGDAEFILRDEEGLATIADLPPASVDLTKSPETQLAPQGSGGMLLALTLWRNFMIRGSDVFGDTVYIGTAPLAGQPQWYDVLSCTYQTIELRLYTDPDSGALLAMELYSDQESDPCEITFSNFVVQGDARIPQRIEVRRGDADQGQFDLQSLTTDRSESL
ncbi:MAG: trypsin-like peptidase domain-containing protein [Pirellulaceae bacterium]|nr:trypsin-like peptidase domain-containing protein [Planctomycetales bacterium]